MIRLEHKGSLYSFDRDVNGRGDWVVLKGKCPGLIGGSTPNVIVPLSFARELTLEAISSGLGSAKQFVTVPAPKPKLKRVSVSSVKKVIKLKGAFNPFKLSFSDKDKEEADSDDPEYEVVDDFKEMELEE